MSEKDEALHSTNYLELRNIEDEEKGIGGYIYSHEKRCDGKIVSILPYRKKNDDGEDTLEFLYRYELTPCWDTEKKFVSSITGGVEGKGVEESVIEEMREEAGYEVTEDELEFYGTCFGTKSSDTVYYLYMVDLTDKERFEAKGDGSYLESQAHCFWDGVEKMKEAVDPLLYVIHDKYNMVLIDRLMNEVAAYNELDELQNKNDKNKK